ncbi:MAG: UDP-N-acetylmuramate--L-alanine ligase [Fermentimonas sp.]|jgi:UDP-N-acetylmuramate--alanine ligase
MMDIKNIYFIGIGGIGMSNLARYFLSKNKRVGGYDRTETELTRSLVDEGALIHYEDDVNMIPQEFMIKGETLVVYTPAIPKTHTEYNYFLSSGFKMMKRAQLLGEITKSSDAICVAGTHGKTTTSSMIAHLLKNSEVECNAFLGGIVKNYNSNLILSDKSRFTVVEADEYDRSFHWLSPHIAIVTSCDPDHLDIYGTKEAYRESFEKFVSLVKPNGYLIIKEGLDINVNVDNSVKVFSYSENSGDCHADNIRIGNGEIVFDYVSKKGIIKDIQLGVPVRINIENSVAAIAVAEICGVTQDEIKESIKSFQGVRRRFDIRLKTPDVVFIDDYAHHPNELMATIKSIKTLYPDDKLLAVFQPHLYTRTRDFAKEFGESLSHADEVILLDIYPAREEPIEGVSSKLIYDNIKLSNKILLSKDELLSHLKDIDIKVLVTFGAGDIDRLLPKIEDALKDKYLSKK